MTEPEDWLEKIVGEALYFEYPHPVIGDVQRKVVLEAVAKIRTALRERTPDTQQMADDVLSGKRRIEEYLAELRGSDD